MSDAIKRIDAIQASLSRASELASIAYRMVDEMPERFTPPTRSPGCCENEIVEWVDEASELYGPEQRGWAIGFTSEMYGDTTYVNVAFCPFCGRKLPMSKEEVEASL